MQHLTKFSRNASGSRHEDGALEVGECTRRGATVPGGFTDAALPAGDVRQNGSSCGLAPLQREDGVQRAAGSGQHGRRGGCSSGATSGGERAAARPSRRRRPPFPAPPGPGPHFTRVTLTRATAPPRPTLAAAERGWRAGAPGPAPRGSRSEASGASPSGKTSEDREDQRRHGRPAKTADDRPDERRRERHPHCPLGRQRWPALQVMPLQTQRPATLHEKVPAVPALQSAASSQRHSGAMNAP